MDKKSRRPLMVGNFRIARSLSSLYIRYVMGEIVVVRVFGVEDVL
jgi:hypothetical protein